MKISVEQLWKVRMSDWIDVREEYMVHTKISLLFFPSFNCVLNSKFNSVRSVVSFAEIL